GGHDRQLAVEGPVAEDLDVLVEVGDEPRLFQRPLIDRAARVEARKVREVDDVELRLERLVREATQREATVDLRLAALEADAFALAGAGARTLLPAAARLALGALAPAEALGALVAAGGLRDVVK